MNEPSYLVLKLEDVPVSDADVVRWLEGCISPERPFLLAHADDGVIWGKWLQGRLLTAHEVAANTDSAHVSPALRGITLQQAFVFGTDEEIRLFRDELGRWQSRRISDGGNKADILEECAILTGNQVVECWPETGFTHLRDRTQQGLEQIVPAHISQEEIDGTAGNPQRVRLLLRHFIEYDSASGEARIGLSRLVTLGIGPAKREEPNHAAAKTS